MAKTIWIPEYLKKNVTESNDDQTLYIDLPDKEQITFLQVELYKTNSTTPSETETILDEVERIEVIADGVKTLYNLEPEIASYIHFLTEGGIFPNHSFNYAPSGSQILELIIPFGRFRFDEEYLLDTGLYDSVQLRIPYTLSDTYSSSGTFRTNIVMWRPLERLSSKGIIRSRVIQKETSSGSAETISHKLPMSYPWRFLGVRFEDDDANIGTDVSAVKLNVDEGRLIPFDLNINELMDMEKMRFPRKSFYWITAALSDGTTIKAHVDYPYPESIVSSGVRALMFKLSSAAGEQVALNIYEADGTAVTDTHAISLKVGGANPHKCMTLYDGREDPFPAPSPEYTQAKVEYTLAAYETIIHTFIQEIVTGKLT